MENEFILGSIDTPSDPRDYRLSDVTCSNDEIEIPNSFKLNDYIPDNTKQIGNTCVSHVLTKIKRYFKNKDYSIGFLYGYRKENQHQRTGLIPREALSNMCEFGDCYKEDFNYESEYPNILKYIENVGADNLLQKANKEKSISYIRLSKDEIKEYMIKNNAPVMIIYKVYDNFYDAKINGGLVPSIPSGDYKGNHAMGCFGWNGDLLINDNSYGNVGDNGLFYVDINSSIIKEVWALTDIKVEKPVNKNDWEKYLTPSGIKWKYKKDGKYITNDWLNIGNDWFRFNEYGIALQNEWFKDLNGYWYYFNENCYMKIGWLLDKGNYYYLSPVHDGYYGHMVTDTVVDGKYKIDSNGCWDWKTIN